MRWAAYLEHKKAYVNWECGFCKSKGLDRKRNCGGAVIGSCRKHGDIKYGNQHINKDTGKALCPECKKVLDTPFELVLGKKYRVWRCPVKDIDVESIFLMKLVSWSEDIGVAPNGGSLLKEPNFYFEARTLIVMEQNQVNREFEEKNKPPTSQSQQPGRSKRPQSRRR